MNLKSGESFSLKPNLSLINSSFEGYKLKLYSDLDTISFIGTFKGYKQIKSDVGYLHTKLISLYNHIHADPFNPLTAFVFDDKYHLHCFSLQELNSSSKLLLCIEPKGTLKVSDFIVPPSISFPSQNLALISNGCNKLSLYTAAERTNPDWKVLLDIDIENSIVAHSLLNKTTGNLHLLLVSVVNSDDLKNDNLLHNLSSILESDKNGLSLHKVQWLTLVEKENQWTILRKRILVGSSALEFLALTEDCEHVVMLCKQLYTFVYDSMKDIAPLVKEAKLVKCLFKQCQKTVTIWVSIADTDLEEVEVKLTSCMEILHLGTSLLKRNFFSPIHIDSAKWKIVGGKIEINLTKSDVFLWETLFADGTDHVEEIHCLDDARQDLMNTGIQNLMTDPESEKPPYNSGQLEDCDMNDDEGMLFFMNGESHLCARFSILCNAQPLFTTVSYLPSAPAFCMRHDVDGLLWSLDGSRSPVHTATFNAFGYVKASKTMAKYTSIPSDNSYVAVCDVRSHVYVFYQSRNIEGQLRNRRSGALVPTYAEQLVITLKNQDEVKGIYAVKEGILILNQDKVTFYSLPNNA